jgi:hypothetical protein
MYFANFDIPQGESHAPNAALSHYFQYRHIQARMTLKVVRIKTKPTLSEMNT